jgi:16S rRNA (guanine527-N7)-methyltransferase
MVIAIARPDLSVTLIEIDQRKSAFLNEVKSRLSLDNVSIVTTDIQTHRMRYDSVTARALASLDQLLEYAHALLAPGAQAIFLKGEQHAEEIAAAETRWAFDCSCTPSVTHPASAILTLSNLTQR